MLLLNLFLFSSQKQQVDNSLSKNQAPKVKTTSDITIKSHEQGFITKECIAAHTN